MKQLFRISLASICALLILAPAAQGQQWKSDPVHSGLHFLITHAMTPMMGSFKSFDVDMIWDADKPEEASITATVDASSVFMANDKLTGHLKSADFFDVENFPEWSFQSKEVQEDDGRYMAVGELTIRGVTKPITIPFEFKGAKETKNGMKAGFVGEFSIDRTAFDVNWDPEAKNVAKAVKIMIFLDMNSSK